MLQIKGIGEKKYELYGEEFQSTIQAWRKENPHVKAKVQIAKPLSFKSKTEQKDEGPSYLVSYKTYQTGKSIKEIAMMRELSTQTIENHLFQAYKKGYSIRWETFFNEKEEQAILKAREQIKECKLKPLKERLPNDHGYSKINAVLVKHHLM